MAITRYKNYQRFDDAVRLEFGTDADAYMVGSGSALSMVNMVGNLTIDNQAVTGKIYADLGTDTSATGFAVRNNSGTSLLTVGGDGAIALPGTLSVTTLERATTLDAQDLTIQLTGATDSSLVLSSTGTGADAVQLTASAGGMDISANGDLDITGGTLSISDGTLSIEADGSGNITETGLVGINLSGSGVGVYTSAGGLTIGDATGNLTWDGAGNLAWAGVGLDLDPTGTVDLAMDAGQGIAVHTAPALATALVIDDGTNNLLVLDTDTNAYSVGNAADNPTLSVLGTGQITLTGNVDALAGLDVTGGGLTQAGGLVTLNATGAVDIDASTTLAATGATGATFEVSGDDAGDLAATLDASNVTGTGTVNVTAKTTVNLGTAAKNPAIDLPGSGALTMSGNPAVDVGTGGLNVGGALTIGTDWGISRQAANVAEVADGDSLYLLGAGIFGIKTASGDVNAYLDFGPLGMRMGAGGASAPDVIMYRQAANIVEFDANDSLYMVGTTQLGVRAATGHANPTIALTSNGLELGAGDASAPDVLLSRLGANALLLADGDSLTLAGGNLILDSDANGLQLGEDQDTLIQHNGTNLVINNDTGEVVIDNGYRAFGQDPGIGGDIKRLAAHAVQALNTGSDTTAITLDIPNGAKIVGWGLNIDVEIDDINSTLGTLSLTGGSVITLGTVGSFSQNTKAGGFVDPHSVSPLVSGSAAQAQFVLSGGADNVPSAGSIEVLVWYETIDTLDNA